MYGLLNSNICCLLFHPFSASWILIILIGIIVMLMGIAGNTNRSIGVQQKIAAAHTPQAILKSEILRCTDPAAQTVLDEKLRTLEEQARTAQANSCLCASVS
jgi:hypothetical protein